MKFDIMRIIGFVFLIATLIVYMLFFKYVDVGERIAPESYTDEGEWLWNLGIFMAIMMGGFWGMLNLSLELLFPKKKDRRKS